jgi:predicted nucleic acid-binding protein
MSQQRFVSNASPLIAFERLNRLDLLQQLTQTLHIPPAVHREVFGAQLFPAWIMAHTLRWWTISLPGAPPNLSVFPLLVPSVC